jgi:hypothetical protein
MGQTLYRADQLRSTGYAADEVRRMLRSGSLTAVRRGVYTRGAQPDDAVLRHALLVRAAVAGLDGSAVVSHVSAAVVHGLPVWGQALDVVQVTRDRRRSGARRGTRVHVHSAPLDGEEVVVLDGVVCTSVARTVVDVARAAPFEQAVVCADAALRAGLERADLYAALRRARGWPGVPAARRAAAFADGGSESVGESRSRVAISVAGLPAPALQWPVRCGRTTAYTDFGWAEQRTVGEFDGKVKYGRLLKPGQDIGEVVYAEKLREDAIRAEDWHVVRWTWADLRDFDTVAVRLRKRLHAA